MIAADKKIDLYKVCATFLRNLACQKKNNFPIYNILIIFAEVPSTWLVFHDCQNDSENVGENAQILAWGKSCTNPGLGESKVAPVCKWRPRRLTRSP